jgi:diadenosine tetraphosphate (Ap4A) HIT family hydrolase
VDGCLICERVALAKDGRNQHLIAEMEHSYFVVGDHQFFKGYALVLLKEHIREPFELPPHVQREHFAEVMRAAKAIHETFAPSKLNYACYGNVEPHVHWHIVPRCAIRFSVLDGSMSLDLGGAYDSGYRCRCRLCAVGPLRFRRWPKHAPSVLAGSKVR